MKRINSLENSLQGNETKTVADYIQGKPRGTLHGEIIIGELIWGKQNQSEFYVGLSHFYSDR